MHIRSLAALACVTAAVLAPLRGQETPVPKPATNAAASKPNIIYFLVDDMGFSDCGFNGGKDIKTPNIDALAAKGSVFESYYVQPLCSTTRATLLTGRYPLHHGVYGALKPDSKGGLPLEERTLPQALRAAGYTTAICGKWHLGESSPEYRPTHRGFDHQYGIWYGQIDYFTHERAGRVEWYRDDKPLKEEGYSTTLIGNEAARLIKAQPYGKPLFLYVPFNGVHGPFQVPDKYREPYKELPPKRQTMAAMLSVVDESIGNVIAALREKKMEEDTLIVFSSDNGGVNPDAYTKNTPLRAGKATTYEGGVRSSAFAVYPGRIPAGKKIATPVHVSDWYPTLVKLTGAEATQSLPVDGMDIWPLLTNGTPPARDALLLGSQPARIAARMGDWKLIRFSGPQAQGQGKGKGARARAAAGGGNQGGRFELYNLADDISEKNNLAESKPEKVAEMRTRLEQMVKGAKKNTERGDSSEE
jgi:arylsulfatase A-like enzyme